MENLEPNIQRKTFEELLDENGVFVYTNVGYSMMPLLRQHRDLIEIRKKGPGRCKKYDIVEGRYVIAGDHNSFLEKDITDDRILGVMTKVIRDGKPITVDDKGYQAYVHLWCDLYPLRVGILKAERKTKAGLSLVKRLMES